MTMGQAITESIIIGLSQLNDETIVQSLLDEEPDEETIEAMNADLLRKAGYQVDEDEIEEGILNMTNKFYETEGIY